MDIFYPDLKPVQTLKYGLYSRDLDTQSPCFMFIFRLLQRFPIILVQRTFLKSGIRVILNYIITLYSPLQTILSLHLRPFCVHASGKHTNVWEPLLYTIMKNLKKNRCHGPGIHPHACSLFYYSGIYQFLKFYFKLFQCYF